MAGMFVVIGSTCLVWEPLHTVLTVVPTKHPGVFGPLARIATLAILEPLVANAGDQDVCSINTLPSPIVEVLERTANGLAGCVLRAACLL